MVRASRRAFEAPQHDLLSLMASKEPVILRRPRLRDAACGGSSGQGGRFEGRTARFRAIPALLALAFGAAALRPVAALADEHHCVRTQNILWGDGRHDDTVALNAWLKGEDAVWGDSGRSIGTAIAGRSFRLSSAIYVVGGTGRSLSDFRLVFPERGEVVTGGTVRAGNNADQPPVSSGVTITGGDSGEGVPFDAPEIAPANAAGPTACPIS